MSDDGNLYDTRQSNWHTKPPLRANFRGHFTTEIQTPTQLKAILRAGAHAWPGGYPLYFVMNDGEAMSFKAVRDNLREVLQALKDEQRFDDWRPAAIEVNWESTDLVCAHTTQPIPSAYGDD